MGGFVCSHQTLELHSKIWYNIFLFVKKGDLYSGSAIAVVEGCNEFIIEAEIDEYDIPDVEVGMKVLIKTNL